GRRSSWLLRLPPGPRETRRDPLDLASQDAPRVEEMVAHSGLAAVQDRRDLARLELFHLSQAKAAFCLPVSRAETCWNRREARSSSAGRVVSLWVSSSRMRTRWSVAVWARSRLRALRRKSIERFVAIRYSQVLNE